MNIFILDIAPAKCAEYHCNKHVVKMILETAQIMSTVYHIHGQSDIAPYKKTHEHHPSVKWAAENKANYQWLAELGFHLCNEYAKRYNRRHACEPIIKRLLVNPPVVLQSGPFKFTEPPQAMPEDCRSENTVEAYRQYYRKYKSVFATWRFGIAPDFMRGALPV